MLLDFVEATMGPEGHIPGFFRPPGVFYGSETTSTLRNADPPFAILGATCDG